MIDQGAVMIEEAIMVFIYWAPQIILEWGKENRRNIVKHVPVTRIFY